MRYVLTTPKNPGFAGKRMGITFTDGRAVVDELSRPRGTTVPLGELVKQLRSDFPGIQVEEVPDTSVTATPSKKEK